MSRSNTWIVVMDRVSRSDTRIVVMDQVSRSDTKIVVVDRVSRSDTRIVEDQSVMFRHQDSMRRIGVSRSDTKIVKKMNLESCKYTQINEPIFPNEYCMEA